MPKPDLDGVAAIALLGELVRLTAPPASRDEICDQGLGILTRALAPACAAISLPDWDSSTRSLCASKGGAPSEELARLGRTALVSAETLKETGPAGGPPLRIAIPFPGEASVAGAVLLESPSVWTPLAVGFASSAVRALAAALQTARTIHESRVQREVLAERSVALETLRELAGRLQNAGGEDKMLQAALDLILEKLGLASGWIFWGDESAGRLELAACRGIAEEFVRASREPGIGTCLCQEVFETGRLMFARNTIDCPRLPELVQGTKPMTHACIPLKFERGVLGVMNIANRPGRFFAAQELQFLETAGNQLCLAVDKVRTGHAENRRNAEARALVTLARAIGGSLELDRVLAAIGGYARELLGADRCAIFLGDGAEPPLFAYLSGPPMTGLEVGEPAHFEAMGSRALHGALRQERTLVIRNALADLEANPDLSRTWGIGSAILIPLIAHAEVGGLLLASRARPSDWSAEEVALADALAAQAAVAIENAGLFRDAQATLVRLQEAQYGMMRAERLAAAGTLAASLAHEVRNPLNSINLQLVLLSRRVAKLAEPERALIADLIETARREIVRLDGLVEEFLSLSTIDRLSLAEADLDGVAREVIVLMSPAAREKKITVVEALSGRLPCLRLDRERIKQVLMNLVRNAIEAMSEGGTLEVVTVAGDGVVSVRVSDTGPGIEPGLDVFDFFMTTKRGGTGLGLPIARRIVEIHGGSLGYESRPGQGTVFSVTLNVT